MLRLTVLCLTPLSSAALACPESIPVSAGLVLVENGPGTRNHFLPTDTGLLQHRLTIKGEISEESTSLYSHPLTVQRLTNAAGTTEIVYGAQVEDLNRIDSLGQWRTDVLLKRDGKVLAVGVDTITYLGTSSVTIANCTYPTWRIEDRMELTGYDPFLFEKDYAPELGLVLRTIQKLADGTVLNDITYLSIDPGP